MSVKDWRPDQESQRPWGDVQIRVLGNLGDKHPLDYGGLIVYEVIDDDIEYIRAEHWNEPLTEDHLYWVYRFDVEKDVFKDLSWVGRWAKIARFAGMHLEALFMLGLSENPLERAEVYRLVGEYHGWENIDGSPEKFTREEMEKRWPEYA